MTKTIYGRHSDALVWAKKTETNLTKPRIGISDESEYDLHVWIEGSGGKAGACVFLSVSAARRLLVAVAEALDGLTEYRPRGGRAR